MDASDVPDFIAELAENAQNFVEEEQEEGEQFYQIINKIVENGAEMIDKMS